jgi:hypothetical protein
MLLAQTSVPCCPASTHTHTHPSLHALHRDNRSDYTVNGRKLPTKEVTALLKAKGIDLDNNRFLILQVWAAC